MLPRSAGFPVPCGRLLLKAAASCSVLGMRRDSLGVDVDGPHLRKLRKERGKSGACLAREAGVSHGYIWQIEKGLRRPNPHVFGRICYALELSAEERARLRINVEQGAA